MHRFRKSRRANKNILEYYSEIKFLFFFLSFAFVIHFLFFPFFTTSLLRCYYIPTDRRVRDYIFCRIILKINMKSAGIQEKGKRTRRGEEGEWGDYYIGNCLIIIERFFSFSIIIICTIIIIMCSIMMKFLL